MAAAGRRGEICRSDWHAWRHRLMLLVVGLLLALLVPEFFPGDRWRLPIYAHAVPYTLMFLAAAFALWSFGLRPDLLALPLAFGAAVLYFSPPGGRFVTAGDGLRICVALGVLFAPLRMASQVEPGGASWKSSYLPTLDGWRAIAILLVIGDHLLRGIANDRHAGAPREIFLQGQLGVNIFFAISGLLITWKLLEEHSQTAAINLKHFYCRRVYRIFPAAFLFLTAMAALALLGWAPSTRLDFASTVLYFRNFVPVTGPSLSTAHFWSLSLEEQFYLVLPATLLFLGMRKFRALGMLLVLACGGWRWYYFHSLAGPHPALTARFRTDLRIDGLLCGCLMAVALQDERWRERIRRFLPTPVWLALLGACAGIVAWAGVRTVLAESVVLPLLLAGTMLSPQKWPARILEWQPLRWIGRISYSLYLWQQFFLLCPVNLPLLRNLHAFPASIAATFVFASLSYYLLERPMIRRAQQQLALPAQSPLRAAAASAG